MCTALLFGIKEFPVQKPKIPLDKTKFRVSSLFQAKAASFPLNIATYSFIMYYPFFSFAFSGLVLNSKLL